MEVSVIISTFNSRDALEKVLWGYAAQTHREFELVIADDGSTDGTEELISRMHSSCDIDLQHVWHPHDGFRKCTILNVAIRAAQTNYLVFTDGDCIPRRDFLEQHVRQARNDCFLSGGCIRLNRAASRRMAMNEIASGEGFQTAWLRRHAALPWRHGLRLTTNRHLASWLDRLTPTRATWNGHNASGWKSDILAVNGFDERMRYGGLDREFGERLVNAGVRPIQIRHRAVCLHLDHPRGYVTAEGWARNHAIRQQTRQEKVRWTAHGLVKVPFAQGQEDDSAALAKGFTFTSDRQAA